MRCTVLSETFLTSPKLTYLAAGLLTIFAGPFLCIPAIPPGHPILICLVFFCYFRQAQSRHVVEKYAFVTLPCLSRKYSALKLEAPHSAL